MTKQQDYINFYISDECKLMIDKMLDEEVNVQAQYVIAEDIRNRFLNKGSDLK